MTPRAHDIRRLLFGSGGLLGLSRTFRILSVGHERRTAIVGSADARTLPITLRTPAPSVSSAGTECARTCSLWTSSRPVKADIASGGVNESVDVLEKMLKATEKPHAPAVLRLKLTALCVNVPYNQRLGRVGVGSFLPDTVECTPRGGQI